MFCASSNLDSFQAIFSQGNHGTETSSRQEGKTGNHSSIPSFDSASRHNGTEKNDSSRQVGKNSTPRTGHNDKNKKKGSPGEWERQPFQIPFNIHQLAGDVVVFYDKDNAGGVVLRSWDKTTMDQVEICIGNIPVDIDLISFYHFIDKLAEGECSQIRFNISYGSMHLAVATISAKTASETARRIDGKTISGVSKLLSRTLFCHLACEGG